MKDNTNFSWVKLAEKISYSSLTSLGYTGGRGVYRGRGCSPDIRPVFCDIVRLHTEADIYIYTDTQHQNSQKIYTSHHLSTAHLNIYPMYTITKIKRRHVDIRNITWIWDNIKFLLCKSYVNEGVTHANILFTDDLWSITFSL